jgi:integrase
MARSKGTDTLPKQTGGWKGILAGILAKHNHMGADGKGTVSNKHQQNRADALYLIFRVLRDELKFSIEDPRNLKVKHIEGLVKYWNEKQLAGETCENYLSYLRNLCEWMDKPGMVLPAQDYDPRFKRDLVAKRDKSFEGNGIDFWEIYDRVVEKDHHVAMQLLLIKAFGLRRKEAVMFRPYVADKDIYIEVYDGSKGKRPRTVPVNDQFKRAVLNQCKNFVSAKLQPVKSHMGNPNLDLKQNLDRYSNVLRMVGLTKADLGVTGHGLRAEYALNQLKARGVTAPLWGGTGKAETEIHTQWARHQVTEELGHSRTSILTAYSGPLNLKNVPSTPDKIAMSGRSMPANQTENPGEEE